MKTKHLALILLASFVVMLSGCSTDPSNHSGLNKIRDIFWKPVDPVVVTPAYQTNRVVWTTNVVNVPSITNTDGTVTAPLTLKIPNGVTNVITVPAVMSSTWDTSATLDTAKTTAGFIPGWGTVAGAGLGLIGTLGKLFLNRNNAKAGIATVQAIDAFRTGLAQAGSQGAAIDKQLTDLLSKAHYDAGVKDVIGKWIDQETGYAAPDISSSLNAPGKT